MFEIKKQTLEFEEQEIYIVAVNFGRSLYVWAGGHANINNLSVTFPLLNSQDKPNNFASSSLFGDNELCNSISSYLYKPVLASMNFDNIEINSGNINEFKQTINKSIVDLYSS
ncbi:hypothetical protein OIY81_148 [Cryptosporidium canis]|nr:hypothetical protein OIY81_148 [Cryptosporidium canis]